MSQALTVAEIEGNYVELLPARTVMSLFGNNPGGPGGNASSTSNGLNAVNLALFGTAIQGNSSAADASGGAGGAQLFVPFGK